MKELMREAYPEKDFKTEFSGIKKQFTYYEMVDFALNAQTIILER